MSRNQRSREGTTNLREEILRDKNFEELIRLVKSLVVKIDKLDSDSQSRHDFLCVKLQQLESKTANLSGEIHDLQQGLDFTNEEVETLKDTLSNKLGLPFKKEKTRGPRASIKKRQHCHVEHSCWRRERFFLSRHRE